MTTLASQIHGTMDINHSDDEMQINSDMIMPEDVDFGEEDLMRDASAELDQDLMNQDSNAEGNASRDDDMLDEDTTDQGTLTMVEDVDIDLVHPSDANNEDEDILYEDEDENINVDEPAQPAQQYQDDEDLLTNESQLASEIPNLTSHVGEVGQVGGKSTLSGDLDGQQEPRGPSQAASLEQTALTFQPVMNEVAKSPNLSQSLPGNGTSLNNIENQEIVKTDDSNSATIINAIENPKPEEDLEEVKTHIDQLSSANNIHETFTLEKDIFENETNTESEKAALTRDSDATISAEDSYEVAAETTAHDDDDDTQETGLITDDVEASQHALHSVIVHYSQAEFALFPPHEDDDVSDFFVEDESLAYQGLDKLLSACRDVLNGSIGDHDEVVIDIPGLGLHISEGSVHATEMTLSQILDVYLALNHNDNVADIPPLACELQTRICLVSQYDFLQRAAQGGKGMLDVPKSKSVHHTQKSEGTLAHETVSTQAYQQANGGESSPHLEQTSANHAASNVLDASVRGSKEGTESQTYDQSHEDTSANLAETAAVIITDQSTNYSGNENEDSGLTHYEDGEEGSSQAVGNVDEHSYGMGKDLATTNQTEEPRLPGDIHNDTDEFASDESVNANAYEKSQITNSERSTEGTEISHTMRMDVGTTAKGGEEQTLSIDEDLFDESNTEVSEDFHGQSVLGQIKSMTGLRDPSNATSDARSQHSQPGNQRAITNQNNENSGQNAQNSIADIAHGQVDHGDDLVESDEETILQITDKEIQPVENDAAIVTHEDNDIGHDNEAAEATFHEALNVESFDASGPSYEGDTVDTIDFDFVEAEGDVDLENTTQPNRLSRSQDKNGSQIHIDASHKSTPSSSKRKAQDTEDDFALAESGTPESKRSRTS